MAKKREWPEVKTIQAQLQAIIDNRLDMWHILTSIQSTPEIIDSRFSELVMGQVNRALTRFDEINQD